MRKYTATVVAALVILTISTNMVRAASLSPELLGRAIGELESFFPPVEGYVVSLVENKAFTDIPSSTGLKPGSELTVFREGDEIVHPLTGQVLGRYETVLGVIRVDEIRKDYTTGMVVAVDQSREIKPGDAVRITSSRLRVTALTPPHAGEESEEWFGRQNEVLIALESSSRFIPVDPEMDLDTVILDEEEKVRELAAEAGLDGIIGLELSGQPSELYLNLRLYSGATGSWVATAKVQEGVTPQVVRAAPQPPVAYPQAPPPAPTAGPGGVSPWESFHPGHPVRSLCYGKLTQDPGLQLVAADINAIYVYTRDAAGWKLIWEDGGERNFENVSLDCGDIDGNGLEEIFLARVGTGLLRSRVLEYQGGVFNDKVDKKNLYFRVARTGPGEWRLFAQPFFKYVAERFQNIKDVSGKPIREYVWDGSDYSSKGGDKIPVRTIHGFGMVDVTGDGDQEVVFLNRDRRIAVYSSTGEKMWTSRDVFGGSELFIKEEKLDQDLPYSISGGYMVQNRVIGADLDGDGAWELILTKNIPVATNIMENLRIFRGSEMGIYRWDGQNMVRVGETERFISNLADYAAVTHEDGSTELIIGFNEGSNAISRGEGEIRNRFYSIMP
jgi:hypothetical protein